MKQFLLKKTWLLPVVGLICLAGGLMAAPISSPIPLETGNRWTYEGKIETTLSGISTIYTTNICWVMEVVDAGKNTHAQAAVVRGFLDELPWYEPGRVPGFCVLLSYRNHVYQFKAPDGKRATAIMQDVLTHPDKCLMKASGFDELFALPLARDKCWGGDTKREDGYYCWKIEEEKRETLHLKGMASSQTNTVYRLAYRTAPDHVLMDVVSGLGITRYFYVHHGTVATVDLHLVLFQHPQ
jgi:hypothetical protein